MAQAADEFLAHVHAIRMMREASIHLVYDYDLPNGIDPICFLFIAAQLGERFFQNQVARLGHFNANMSVRALLRAGLIEDADERDVARRSRPMRLTDKGRRAVAQLEAAMMPAADGERVAA